MSITLQESPVTRDAVRPWGLRGMQPTPRTGTEIGEWRYDHERQITVDGQGERLLGPAMSVRTYSVPDPGSEDTLPDFVPDVAA
ncbi:putative ATP-grasp-modified RiPP [Saccharopolyspora shandongensis]|uniref:putative ATP-grasp-modified RiPP n=1 Tax=Saccharopolyspora shandongensis TaxID=418495 RepID=UPI00341C23D8